AALSETDLVARGDRPGPVDHPGHARVLDGRDAGDGPLHDRLEARPVRVQQAMIEVRRQAVEELRLRVTLVAAHAQPADLLAEVAQPVGVAHRGQRRRRALDGVREQVLVGHRDDRDGHAGHAADLGRVHPARIADDLRFDRLTVAALRLDLDALDAALVDGDADHARVLADRGGAGARTRRERARTPARV